MRQKFRKMFIVLQIKYCYRVLQRFSKPFERYLNEGTQKMKIFRLSPLIFLTACGTSLPTDTSSLSSDAVLSNSSGLETAQEEIVWEDLRIQQLLPDFLAIPAIEPFLPSNFVALPHPDIMKRDGLYWGPKEVLEEYYLSGKKHIISPIIWVTHSYDVGQNEDGTFTGEDTFYEDMIADGCTDIKIDKLYWGNHPIMSVEYTQDGRRARIAWIGLNSHGHVLLMSPFGSSDPNTSSENAFQIWTDFLTKSRFLEGHDFYKSHGQDMREGFTLVNICGSVLKVLAEKRIRDGKIQIKIQPADHTISCKCLGVEQMLMPAKWHFFEPIVKIQTESQVNNARINIRYSQTITILLKEVTEFSDTGKIDEANGVTNKTFNNISIFNLCDRNEVISPLTEKLINILN